MGRDITDRVKLPRARKASAAMSIPPPKTSGPLCAWRTGGSPPTWRVRSRVCAEGQLRHSRSVMLTSCARRSESPAGAMDRRRPAGDPRTEVRFRANCVHPGPACHDDLRTCACAPAGCRPGAVVVPQHPELELSRTRGHGRQGVAGIAGQGRRQHRLHGLPHFYASGLIAAGCDVVTVRARSLIGGAHPDDVLTSVAGCHRPDPQRRLRATGPSPWRCCGRTADGRAKRGF